MFMPKKNMIQSRGESLFFLRPKKEEEEMSQTVEDMLNGLICQVCGSFMDDFEAPGYPRTCEDCEDCEEEK